MESPGDESPDDTHARSVALMAEVRSGNMDAFQELVELHQHAVIGTAAKMLGNIDDAHDISQKVFVRVWKAAPRYEPKAKFTTWLFTITRNLVFNESRRRSRHPEVSLDGLDSDVPFDRPDPAAAPPDAAVLESELDGAIRAAIERLPEKQRMAVVLRRYQELPYEEIAEVLELSVSAVKSQLFRARTQLREDLKSYLDAE